MAWTEINLIILRPVNGAAQMRAATVEDQQVLGILRFADDKSTVTGGCPLPAIDLDARERKRSRLADRQFLQLPHWNPVLFDAFFQGRVYQIGNRRNPNHRGDQATHNCSDSFDEFPPVNWLRHMHLQYDSPRLP